jgi:hypothetical protein
MKTSYTRPPAKTPYTRPPIQDLLRRPPAKTSCEDPLYKTPILEGSQKTNSKNKNENLSKNIFTPLEI